MDTINGFIECGFVNLEEIQDKEIVIGFLLGLGKIKFISSDEFKTFSENKYIKGVWNFSISENKNKSILSTETRVHCPNKIARIIFSLYWFVISYFSRVTRKEMLRVIKEEAELIPEKLRKGQSPKSTG